MFVRLHHNPQHPRSLEAFLFHQTGPDVKNMVKGELNDSIEIFSMLPSFESVGAAYCQNTLQASKHGVRIVGAEELHGNVHKIGPFLGEIMLEYLLQYWYELRSYLRLGRGEYGKKSITEGELLFLRDGPM